MAPRDIHNSKWISTSCSEDKDQSHAGKSARTGTIMEDIIQEGNRGV